jgi:hypothetical protein
MITITKLNDVWQQNTGYTPTQEELAGLKTENAAAVMESIRAKSITQPSGVEFELAQEVYSAVSKNLPADARSLHFSVNIGANLDYTGILNYHTGGNHVQKRFSATTN